MDARLELPRSRSREPPPASRAPAKALSRLAERSPAFWRAAERSALRVDDAEALPRRCLHDPPALEESDATCAERLQAGDLGVEIVALDVEMDAAIVLHALHQQERLRVGARELAVIGVVVGLALPGASERLRPEFGGAVEIVDLAVEDERR